MELGRKLAVLADAAKYDASCASSGSKGRRATTAHGVGSTEGMGICHSYTPDGRCVSLLKLLLTNYCLYDCLYCVNRRSSDVPRARFSVVEVVRLTLDFYRRNYIEGLFLSSGIIRSPDYTMEQLALVARTLRVEHDFQGYIHLKTIPHADPGLIAEAGRWADRLSINVELPTQEALTQLAPEKNLGVIRGAMSAIRTRIDESKAERATVARQAPSVVGPTPLVQARRAARITGAPQPFAPAGQSTQLIVGATDASDAIILGAATTLYQAHRLRRVYYSAFSPIPDASAMLPPVAPPLVREHRLYQADWLVRFYGFEASELTTLAAPNLDLELDPKTAWALRHRALFPVDVNVAPRELLLRVPGVGARSVERMLAVRRWRRLRVADLAALRVALRRALPFIVTADGAGSAQPLDAADLRTRLLGRRTQLDLFAPSLAAVRPAALLHTAPQASRQSVLFGEL